MARQWLTLRSDQNPAIVSCRFGNGRSRITFEFRMERGEMRIESTVGISGLLGFAEPDLCEILDMAEDGDDLAMLTGLAESTLAQQRPTNVKIEVLR